VALEAIGYAAVALAIVAYGRSGVKPPSDENALLVLWLLAALGFLWKLFELAALMRRSPARSSGRSQARPEKAEDDTVAWLLKRPAYSPSREQAQRSLPEYSARLLAAGRNAATRR